MAEEDWQAGSERDGQETEILNERQTDGRTHADRQAHRQTGRVTERQTGDRDTE